MIIDRRFTTFKGKPSLAAALHAENDLHIQVHQLKRQGRDHIQRCRTLAAEFQPLRGLQLGQISRATHAQFRAHIQNAAGWARHQHAPGAVIIAHARIAHKIRELRGTAGAQDGQPIRPRALRELIGAIDAAAAGDIADHDCRIAGHVLLQQRQMKPRPDIGTTAHREGDDPFNGFAGHVLRARSACRGQAKAKPAKGAARE